MRPAESVYTRRELNSHRIGLVQQYVLHFIGLEHHDVTCIHCSNIITTDCKNLLVFFNISHLYIAHKDPCL